MNSNQSNGLDAAQGILNGCILAIPIWAILIIIVSLFYWLLKF